MKQKILLRVMMMTMALVVTSCNKNEDDDISSTSEYVGEWVCYSYCQPDDTSVLTPMNAEDGFPFTKVTLNADGTCSGSGMVINGGGTWTIKPGNGWEDGYWAIITFYQNGRTVNTATVVSYKNDHRTGYVRLQGYPDKWFVFKK